MSRTTFMFVNQSVTFANVEHLHMSGNNSIMVMTTEEISSMAGNLASFVYSGIFYNHHELNAREQDQIDDVPIMLI